MTRPAPKRGDLIAFDRDELDILNAAAGLRVRICRTAGDLMDDTEREEAMNVQRYEQELIKDADKLHERAQRSGQAVDYIKAAEEYEKAGNYRQAAKCREAAERLERR